MTENNELVELPLRQFEKDIGEGRGWLEKTRASLPLTFYKVLRLQSDITRIRIYKITLENISLQVFHNVNH